MARRTFVLIPVLVSLALAGAALAAQVPLAVSPGAASKVAPIGDGCPTFSWGAAEGATSYELVVYRLAEEGEEAQPVLKETVAGSASSWTPSLDRCLDRGEQYAWSVRAVDKKGTSEWSPLSLFEVASGPSDAEFEELLAWVKRNPARDDSGEPDTPPSANRAVPGKVGPGGRAPLADPRELAGATPSGVAISEGSILLNGRPVAFTEGKIVFVTSTLHNGNLGGLLAADAICNSLAEAAGLAGTYKAWLSVDSCSVAQVCRDFTQSTEPYIRMDGLRIADDWADLIDGTRLQRAILLDENAKAGPEAVWTNTLGNGMALGQQLDCLDWNNGTDVFFSRSGDPTSSGGPFLDNWTNFGNPPCNASMGLYCFEQ